MATVTLPTAPASLMVSPVDDTNIALLSRVSTRISGGAQAANAAGGVSWASNMVTTAYDLVLGNAYRDALVFDQFATKRPTAQTHNGAVVSFPLANDIADDVAGATLDENYDVLPSVFKTAHVEVGMAEYGRVITRTNLLRGTSMLPFDPVAAERIARNAVSTMDRLALAKIYAAGGIQSTANPAVFGTAGAVPTAVAGVVGTAAVLGPSGQHVPRRHLLGGVTRVGRCGVAHRVPPGPLCRRGVGGVLSADEPPRQVDEALLVVAAHRAEVGERGVSRRLPAGDDAVAGGVLVDTRGRRALIDRGEAHPPAAVVGRCGLRGRPARCVEVVVEAVPCAHRHPALRSWPSR